VFLLQALSDKHEICSAEHIALSFDGVTQSTTLLKNLNATLPLRKGRSAAVIGPNANLSKVTHETLFCFSPSIFL